MGNDNASSALKFAIGLAVTMILIALVIVAFTFARSHANSAISNMSKDTAQVEESRYTQYDGVTVTGAEVLNLIEKFSSDNIGIGVKNSTGINRNTLSTLPSPTTVAGDKIYITGMTSADLTTALRLAKDPTNAAYITPSKDFYGMVVRDSNTDAILGINFYKIN